MNIEFNETHKMIRETAREFANNELAESADERDEKEIFPTDAVKNLANLDLWE